MMDAWWLRRFCPARFRSQRDNFMELVLLNHTTPKSPVSERVVNSIPAKISWGKEPLLSFVPISILRIVFRAICPSKHFERRIKTRLWWIVNFSFAMLKGLWDAETSFRGFYPVVVGVVAVEGIETSLMQVAKPNKSIWKPHDRCIGGSCDFEFVCFKFVQIGRRYEIQWNI